MLKNSRFQSLMEDKLTRYRLGGFLVGDQIKFNSSIKSNECYKNLNKSITSILDDIISQSNSGDAIVKIVSINNYPMMGGVGSPEPATFEIGIDGGGGQYLTIVALPGSLINEIERVVPEGDNLPETIAPNKKITYCNNPDINVELTDEDQEGEEENMIPVKMPVNKLPKSNTKLNSTTAKETDYTKGIKSKQNINNYKVDTVSKA